MSRSLRLIPLAPLAAITLAACGSSHGPSVPSLGGGTHASPAPGSLAAARAAVACVRRHGMSGVPDPVVGAGGQITVPGYTTAQLTPAARSACAAQIRAAQASASNLPNVSASDARALLRYAACLRAHGLPRWPDPNAQGVFHVRSADAGTLATGERADAACRSLRGSSLARIDVTPSGH